MPKSARLLDLGSGAGAVLEEISGARPDMKLTGVDFVAAPPKAGRKYELKAPVRMEELPYADSTFHAVTSQFGFEYSDMEKAAIEAARVLRPDGSLLFMIHDRSGPIVEHNRERRTALQWALGESGCFEIASRVIASRKLFPLPTPPALDQAVSRARADFPPHSVAIEILSALREIVTDGERESATRSQQRLGWLEDHARHELAMIDALLRVAQDEQGIRSIRDRLSGAGLEIQAPDGLRDPITGLQFAWIVRGLKPTRLS
jgi:SAM-dependent methyltransferase